MSAENPRPGTYGVDAPGVVRIFFFAGALFLGVCVVGLGAGSPSAIVSVSLGIALVAFAEGGLMLYSSKVAKLRERVRVVDRAELRPTDAVLDVGCGRGLLLTEAARRLTDGGRATGIDVWSLEDQSGNDPEMTAKNVEREGVAERVDIKTGDARHLPFEEASFDAVVSSMTLHNITDPDERELAVREIARVLRPGGRVVVLDMAKTEQYAAVLGDLGFLGVERSPRSWRMFPPVRYVTGTKA